MAHNFINLKGDYPKMVAYQDAVQSIVSKANELSKTVSPDSVVVSAAIGRVLSEDLFAKESVPSFNNSAMDGYAICFSKNSSATFEVVGSAFAGSLEDFQIEPGEALEIMTGGKIPRGASAVVPIELIDINGSSIYNHCVTTGRD